MGDRSDFSKTACPGHVDDVVIRGQTGRSVSGTALVGLPAICCEVPILFLLACASER